MLELDNKLIDLVQKPKETPAPQPEPKEEESSSSSSESSSDDDIPMPSQDLDVYQPYSQQGADSMWNTFKDSNLDGYHDFSGSFSSMMDFDRTDIFK